jgi:hypothetical protein
MKTTRAILFVLITFTLVNPRFAAANTFCKIYVPAMATGLLATLLLSRGSSGRISAGIYLAAMLPCLFTVAYANEVLRDTDKALKKSGPYSTLVEHVGQNDANYILEMVIRGESYDDIAKTIELLAGTEDNIT